MKVKSHVTNPYWQRGHTLADLARFLREGRGNPLPFPSSLLTALPFSLLFLPACSKVAPEIKLGDLGSTVSSIKWIITFGRNAGSLQAAT